jgi:hypothetical protein
MRSVMNQNRWRGALQRGAEMKGEGDLLAEASRMRDDENQQKLLAGHNPLVGGYHWQEFEDFHKVRQNMEALKGNKYKVGSISGSGDINQRPASGAGPTFQVNGSTASRPSVQALSSGSTRMPSSRSVDALGSSDWGLLARRAATPEQALLQQKLQRLFDAQVSSAEAAAMIDRREADPQWAPGTPNWYNRQRMRKGLEREVESDASWQQAADKSGQYWQYDEPREANEHTRRLALTTAQAEPARVAAQSRTQVADINRDGRLSQEELRQLGNIMTQLRQGESGAFGYNDDRAGALGQRFDQVQGDMLNRVGGAGAPAGGDVPDRPGSYVGHRMRDQETGRRFEWDGQQWQPVQ